MATVAQVGALVESTINRLRGNQGPFSDWTPVQTLDHLAQVHRLVLLGLRAKEPMPQRPFFLTVRRRVVNIVMSNAIPVSARGALPTCAADADFESMSAELLKLQAKLEKRSGEGIDPSWMVMRHPVGGPLNFDETIAFVEAHLIYHFKRAGK